MQNYFFTKGIKKHDEFKKDIKSFSMLLVNEKSAFKT